MTNATSAATSNDTARPQEAQGSYTAAWKEADFKERVQSGQPLDVSSGHSHPTLRNVTSGVTAQAARDSDAARWRGLGV